MYYTAGPKQSKMSRISYYNVHYNYNNERRLLLETVNPFTATSRDRATMLNSHRDSHERKSGHSANIWNVFLKIMEVGFLTYENREKLSFRQF